MKFQGDACVSLDLLSAQRLDPQNYFCTMIPGGWYKTRIIDKVISMLKYDQILAVEKALILHRDLKNENS